MGIDDKETWDKMFYPEIADKLKTQMTFFDYIYPNISRRLDTLEKENDARYRQILTLQQEKNFMQLMVKQYKTKIQRIEQFLIERGLIELLGK
jgi:hypothetical protein